MLGGIKGVLEIAHQDQEEGFASRVRERKRHRAPLGSFQAYICPFIRYSAVQHGWL
jgi:hypothetical protein